MAELVFWRMFDYLKGLCPEFASCKYRGFLSRFKERAIHALDSSTIQLTLNCFDWARHRRQKAAAKLHMNLDLGNRLPSFAIVEEASHHDSVRAEATTANLKCGDILVADRAYTDFKFLCSLAMRGVFYVVRWKRNIKLEVVSARPVEKPEAGKRSEARVRVLKDEIVKPAMPGTAKEICAIFLAMGTGLITGMGYLGLAAIFSAVLSLAIIVFNRVDLGSKKNADRYKSFRIMIRCVPLFKAQRLETR